MTLKSSCNIRWVPLGYQQLPFLGSWSTLFYSAAVAAQPCHAIQSLLPQPCWLLLVISQVGKFMKVTHLKDASRKWHLCAWNLKFWISLYDSD